MDMLKAPVLGCADSQGTATLEPYVLTVHSPSPHRAHAHTHHAFLWQIPQPLGPQAPTVSSPDLKQQ